MLLMITLGTIYATTFQNVSAVGDNIISSVNEINSSTANGPTLSASDYFGTSIADIGDMNGDGISDVAVGALGDNGYTGAIHVMFMNRNGTVSDTIKINNNTKNGPLLYSGDQFGASIANIGDLNGDGISDVAVGARNDDTGNTDSGVIHIMFMNGNGTILRTVEINSTSTNGPVLGNKDQFGSAIANIGDLNGDGISDIAVGAIGDNNLAGAVHVMFMNRNGTVSNTIEINSGTTNGPSLYSDDRFGASIANIGDLNGDGISDIAVGAWGNRNLEDGSGDPRADSGAVHIILLNSNGSISRTIEINVHTLGEVIVSSYNRFGFSIANIGDLNGDGISDVAVGQPYHDADGSSALFSDNTGATHVLLLNSDGSTSRTISIDERTSGLVLSRGDYFGSSIANIGDLDGDGTSDIAVAAYGDDSASGNDVGTVHVMFIDAPPIISNITSNATSFGVLLVGDTILFTLTPDSAEVGLTISGTYNSVALSWNSINNGTTYTANYTVSNRDADQTTPLQITGVIMTDAAGDSSLPFSGTDILYTIDANPPAFSSRSDSSTQTTVTFSREISGVLRFSEWSFDGNTPTRVAGYDNNSILSSITRLVFTHTDATSQTLNVTYTGSNNLADRSSNVLIAATVISSDGIIPTFTAQSFSATRTIITFSERVSGVLTFSEWSYAGNTPTAVLGHSNAETLSSITELIFTHSASQMSAVTYTGTSLIDDSSHSVAAATVSISASIPITNYTVSSEDDTPTDVTFSNDGTRMFVVGQQNNKVYEYALSAPFDVTSSTFSASLSLSLQDVNPRGIAVSNNGEKMFIAGLASNMVYEYALSVPFNVTSFTSSNSSALSTLDSFPTDVTFSNDGARMFVTGFNTDSVYEYALSVPFNVLNFTLDGFFDMSSQDNSIHGVAFSNDGTRMFAVGGQNDRVYVYALSAPFSVSSSTFTKSFDISLKDTFPQGITFSNDGTRMFIVGDQNDKVYEYALFAPFDLFITPSTFTARSDSSTQTTVTFSDIVSGTLTLSEWSFAGNTPTAVAGYNDADTLVDITAITFTHDIASQTPTVTYTGTSLIDNLSSKVATGSITATDGISPTFTARSDSFTQTRVTFDESVSGTLIFSEWGFAGNTPTAVAGYNDADTLVDITELVFTHNATNDSTPNVEYTGTSLADGFSNSVDMITVTATDGILTTSCTVPTSGDWIITTGCTTSSDVIVLGNVLVQNNSLLIITDGTTLNIDFANNNLTVESGSGVLIKSGGTIT